VSVGIDQQSPEMKQFGSSVPDSVVPDLQRQPRRDPYFASHVALMLERSWCFTMVVAKLGSMQRSAAKRKLRPR
jgi:hypothetical protein